MCIDLYTYKQNHTFNYILSFIKLLSLCVQHFYVHTWTHRQTYSVACIYLQHDSSELVLAAAPYDCTHICTDMHAYIQTLTHTHVHTYSHAYTHKHTHTHNMAAVVPFCPITLYYHPRNNHTQYKACSIGSNNKAISGQEQREEKGRGNELKLTFTPLSDCCIILKQQSSSSHSQRQTLIIFLNCGFHLYLLYY